MRDFYITTDSNSDLPKEYIEKFGAVIIPQYYSFGDTVYGDELHMPPAEFYQRMKNWELPLSQANNPAVIENKFRANELKEKGISYERIVEAINELKEHINVQFMVDDLFHLQRGGRVSKTTAVVGSALNLKPFLYVNVDGGLSSDGTTRGRKKYIRMLVERMKDTLDENTNFADVIINDISPSIGTHAGPGALGVIYHGKEKQPAK